MFVRSASVNTTNRSGNIKNSRSNSNSSGGSALSVDSAGGGAAASKYIYTRMARSNDSFDNLDDKQHTGYYTPPQLNRPHVLEVNKYDADFVDGDVDVGAGTPQKRSNNSVMPTPTSTPSHKSQTSLSSKKPEKPRSGPSSRRTVLVIASFFVVGTIFMISGIIVLCTQRHPAFDTAGAVFVAVGAVSYVLCLFLQQKNVKKLMRDLEQDLYFLNIHESPLLRTFFSFDGNTAANGGPPTFRPTPRP